MVTCRSTCSPRRSRKSQTQSVSPLDSKAAITYLQQAKTAGIPVIASTLRRQRHTAHQPAPRTTSRPRYARQDGELIVVAVSAAVFVHDQTSRTGIDRRDGFVNCINSKYPKITRKPAVWRWDQHQLDRPRQGYIQSHRTSRVSSSD